MATLIKMFDIEILFRDLFLFYSKYFQSLHTSFSEAVIAIALKIHNIVTRGSEYQLFF